MNTLTLPLRCSICKKSVDPKRRGLDWVNYIDLMVACGDCLALGWDEP